jgi:hypothetical protein
MLYLKRKQGYFWLEISPRRNAEEHTAAYISDSPIGEPPIFLVFRNTRVVDYSQKRRIAITKAHQLLVEYGKNLAERLEEDFCDKTLRK